MRIIPISQQASGAFNAGQIIENKPIGFPQDGGFVRPYSSLFYWARAEGLIDSTIGLHPHQGFEIMSFVLEGKIRHFDTQANAWKPLEAGDVQIIRAGSGISHAEHIEKDGVIFQIWVDPDLSKTLPKEASYSDYKAAAFATEKSENATITYYAGAKGIMQLDTPGVDIRRIDIAAGNFHIDGDAASIQSLYILHGSGMLNGKTVEKDDFVIIDDGVDVLFESHPAGLEIFMMSTPLHLPYVPYAKRFAS